MPVELVSFLLQARLLGIGSKNSHVLAHRQAGPGLQSGAVPILKLTLGVWQVRECVYLPVPHSRSDEAGSR